jgi:hypothetical protein
MAFGRDYKTIIRGGNQLYMWDLGKFFDANGPTVPFEELNETATANANTALAEAAEAEETTTVIQHESNKWPDPPAEAAYHGVAGDIVRAIAPYTEADPVGILGSFLAFFGALAGPRCTFYGAGNQRSNIFVSLVGQTALGRKGTAYSAVTQIMSKIDDSWQERLVTGLGSGEGLITYLQANPDHPALVYEGEFGALLTAMSRDGSTLSMTIRNAWDGIPLGRHIASKSAQVANHHVGILTNITDIELSQRLTSEDAANGFANRFLWLAVKRQQLVAITEPLAPHAEPFFLALHDAFAFTDQPQTMRLTPEARVYWNALYQQRSEQPRAGMHGAVTNRAETYITRLAMLYAMLDATPNIDIVHIQAAEALWDYAERSALYIFGDSTGNKKADALIRQLGIDPTEPMGWEDAKKAIGIQRAEEFNAVVSFLERLGRITEIEVKRSPGKGSGKGSGGRPKRLLRLRDPLSKPPNNTYPSTEA